MNSASEPILQDEFPELDPHFAIVATAYEVHRKTGLSLKMALAILLGVAAHAAQGIYDVHTNKYGKSILSLIIKIAANSGLGKSQLLKEFTDPLVDHQNKLSDRHDHEDNNHESEKNLWNSVEKALNKEFVAAMKAGKDTTEAMNKIDAHRKKKPQKSTDPTMMESDITLEAMLAAQCSLLLAVSEGEIFYDPRKYKKLAPYITEIYSGTRSLSHNRKSTGRTKVANRLWTFIVMSQEHVMYKFLEKLGEFADEIGELPRSLICLVEDTRGKTDQLASSCETPYFDRLKVLLESLYTRSDILLKNPDSPRETVYLSAESEIVLEELRNNLNQKMATGKPLNHYKAAASRVCENAVRIAAILHIFNGEQGEIQARTLRQAIAITRIFFLDYLKLRCPKTKAARNAEILASWFNEHYIAEGRRYITQAYLGSEIIPKWLRTADIRRPALNHLAKNGIIRFFTKGDTVCIDLNPNSFFDERKAFEELQSWEGVKGHINYTPHTDIHPGLRVATSIHGQEYLEMKESPFRIIPGFDLELLERRKRAMQEEEDAKDIFLIPQKL